MIEASYHDSVNVLQGLSCSDTCSPFDRPEWYRLLVEAGLEPLVITASSGQASAALALVEKDGHIAPLRNWYSFTWRQLAPDGEEGDCLLVSIANRLRDKGYRVTLEPVPEEDGSHQRLARAFSAAGWLVRTTRCASNHVLPVRGRSFEEYWSDRPGKLRTTLKRKAKKVDTIIHSDFDPAAWAHYETTYDASWKPAEDYPEMLREFAIQEGKAGRLRLGVAYHEGKAVAAQCWTVENGIAYIHKLAHLESHKRLSAGTTLSAALFERVIDIDRVSLVDFGNGDEPYKADWMDEVRPRFRIDCIDPRVPRGWLAIGRRWVSGLRP